MKREKCIWILFEKRGYLQEKYKEIKCVYGSEGLDYIATIDEVDIVLNAIVVLLVYYQRSMPLKLKRILHLLIKKL